MSRARVALAVPLACVLLGATEPTPGAYCPFPTEGELPKCMDPARESYGEFFAGLEAGDVSAAEAARVEADVARGNADALSSLVYGYFQVARRLSQDPDDPDLVATLEGWNALLLSSWERSDKDPLFRATLRQAVGDLQERAPAVRLACVDAAGEPAQCDSAEAVLRGMNEMRARVGVRGALARLLDRILGRSAP